jgi:hypothetical protein
MFDKYNAETEGPPHVTAHEHRAQAAGSARFLKELEEAAAQKAIDSFRLRNSSFDGVLDYWRASSADEWVFRVTFMVNGKQKKAEHREFGRDFSVETVIGELQRQVGEAIAGEILAPLFTQALNKFDLRGAVERSVRT